jgi:YesN/AraC family two-component response regulator
MDLANSFNIPIHKCSALINNYIRKYFRDWINQYRIGYFIQSYPNKSEKLTIDAIVLESGFSSMTTFYRAFKKETGKMPLDYFSN